MLFLIDNLLIRERCLSLRIPVDHAQTAINQAFLIKVTEYFDYRTTALFIHSKRGAIPIARATERTKLLEDNATMFISPIPRMFEELLTSKVRLIDALLFQSFDYLSLGSNRSMIRTRHPTRILSLLTSTANEDILNSLIQHMPHMEHTRYIWGRNNNGISRTTIWL